MTVALGTAQTVTNNQWFTQSGGQSSLFNNQQPNASTKRYPVSGSVINALTGAPVVRAVVRLQGMEPAQVFTGDDGHFEFKDVAEGRIFLFAQRPGFQVANRGPQQQVTVGASASSIQLKLVPESSLRGHVLNSDGEPVEGVSVQVFRRQIQNGVRDWMPANSANTDETGAFVIEDLAPGAYLLHTNAHRVFAASSSVVVDGRHFPDLYLAQYYPNALDRTSAQPIQIQAGLEAQADLTLTPVPSYTASGSVANTNSYSASCENAEGEVVSNAFRKDRDGRFTLMQLPSGACTLRVRTGMRGEDSAYGELPINIGSGDLTGLQLNFDALPDIPIVTTGGANGNNNTGNQTNPGANVQLIPRQMNQNRGFPMQMRKGDAMVFSAVAPGTYRIQVQTFGGNCLASVTSGNVDLLRSDLTVSSGGSPAPIDVKLRTDCGSITGTVEGANPTDPVSVVAVPQGAPTQAKVMHSNSGSIQIPDLTPGDYTLYAATDLSEFPYADPEALKGLDGQKVTVGPSAKITVQLQLMTVPGMAAAGESR